MLGNPFGVLLLALAILFCSCKKTELDTNITDPDIPKGLIKSKTVVEGNNLKDIFEYNSDKKLAKIARYLGGQPYEWIAFEYHKTTIISIIYDNFPLSETGRDTLFMNEKGLVYLINKYIKTPTGYQYAESQRYDYDKDNYLIKYSSEKKYPSGPCQTFRNITVSSQNTTYAELIFECAPEANFQISNLFYSENYNTLDNEYQGQPYLGKTNIKPIQRSTWMKGLKFLSEDSYQYKFNTAGLIVEMICTNRNENYVTGSITTIYEYY